LFIKETDYSIAPVYSGAAKQGAVGLEKIKKILCYQ